MAGIERASGALPNPGGPVIKTLWAQFASPPPSVRPIATCLRILEALRLEEEQAVVGWQGDPDVGTVAIQDVAREFDVELEDADFAVLAQLAAQWDRWPTAQESLALKEKLGL
jgi:hypothetical protein